nr:DUF87 domain-containing protein [Actinomadura rayongensis]
MARVASGLDWAATSEHAWKNPPFHVDALHRQAESLVLAGIAEARASQDASPLGVVLQGEGGVGKTHFLSWVRGRVGAVGGYFFLLDFSVEGDFWALAARAMVEDLGRPGATDDARSTQVAVLMRRLAALAGADEATSAALAGETPCTKDDLDALVDGLLVHDRRLVARCADTLRALALYASPAMRTLDVGRDHLTSTEEAEPGDRRAWGMSRRVKGPQEIVIDLSAILALTGPSVIAVDQVDSLLQHTAKAQRVDRPDDGAPDDVTTLERVAGGLMALRQTTRRTLCLIACLPSSWKLVRGQAVETVTDRFRAAPVLATLSDADVARDLVERRIGAALAGSGFTPPVPSWPVAPAAFATAPGHTPRALLKKIHAHVETCRRDGAVRLLESFADEQAAPREPTAPPPVRVPLADLPALDARFAELRAAADIGAAVNPETEDATVPALLAAALKAWTIEQGPAGEAFRVDPPPGRRPELHARLRQVLDEATDVQRHWAFRAIGAPHHLAAQKRLDDAFTAAGVTPDGTDRTLVILRTVPWSTGPKTQAKLQALADGGGLSVPLVGDDLRTFAALATMLAEDRADLHDWLRARRPAGGTELLTRVLGEAAAPPPEPERAENSVGRIRIGTRVRRGDPVELELATLTRHTAVFAGSGSGKTVLLRRLVEECALSGVSAIVLDPNNDLARLGDPWPSPPDGWTGDDAARAREYLATTDVVVWTPGRAGGRPLSFQPLPDLGAVRDSPDELRSALDIAVEALSPRANVTGKTRKAQLGQAVLREALAHFARSGGGSFTSFLDLLGELPVEASQIDKAAQIAGELEQALTAATVNDPLFAGGGVPVDPGTLLTPAPGKRARVSVISLVGLGDERRESFVSQLQVALFAWIKRNPARDRPLGALYVMDEAQILAGTSPRSAALESTLMLSSQARKYGLGLVFATQAPKGLHNKIAGSATTQFIGKLSSPVQIAAAKELARAKGGNADQVGILGQGHFYVASDGLSFVQARTPLCLTHHPSDPLTEDEIVERARR